MITFLTEVLFTENCFTILSKTWIAYRGMQKRCWHAKILMAKKDGMGKINKSF